MWKPPPDLWRGAAAAAVVLLAAAAVPLAEYFFIGCERLFNPFSTRHWPHETTIALEQPETGWTVPQLEALPIRASVTGAVPPELVLAYRCQSTGYWIKERIPVREDGSAAYTFPEVREPFSFYLRGGDYTTDTQRVTIIERPYLKRIVAHYEYPEYAGLPNRDLESGQLFGLEGTKVRLEFESSMRLSKSAFVMDGREEELPLATPKTFEKTLVLSADGSYEVRLYQQSGFREAKPERYEVRVTPDNPPEVELLSPGQNLVATTRAAIPVAFRASDDFGLKKVESLYQLGQVAAVPLSDRITGPLAPQGKTHQARFIWNLLKMEGLPDTGVLQYFVRVTDVNPTGRGVAETAKLQIKLVRPSEFHFETFERAKRLEAEARIAWENQFEAWKLAADWPSRGGGSENDPLWQELKEKQDKDLEQTVSVLDELNNAQVLQRDVVRKVGRFVKFPAKDSLLVTTEKANRARAAGLGAVLALKLGPSADDITSAAKDEALTISLKQVAEQVAEAVRSLKDLLGEREQPQLAQKGPEGQGPKGITLEEWQRLRSPASLALSERLTPADGDAERPRTPSPRRAWEPEILYFGFVCSSRPWLAQQAPKNSGSTTARAPGAWSSGSRTTSWPCCFPPARNARSRWRTSSRSASWAATRCWCRSARRSSASSTAAGSAARSSATRATWSRCRRPSPARAS